MRERKPWIHWEFFSGENGLRGETGTNSHSGGWAGCPLESGWSGGEGRVLCKVGGRGEGHSGNRKGRTSVGRILSRVMFMAVCGSWLQERGVSATPAGRGWVCGGGGERRRAVPVGIMTDSAVAEADLMTLPPARGLRFSAVESPVSCWCRARRSTKSLVALGADGSSSFGGCSSPAFDLSPRGEWRERDDDASPAAQDPPPGTPGDPPQALPTQPPGDLCPTFPRFLFKRLEGVPFSGEVDLVVLSRLKTQDLGGV